jgi:hypothetical protein
MHVVWREERGSSRWDDDGRAEKTGENRGAFPEGIRRGPVQVGPYEVRCHARVPWAWDHPQGKIGQVGAGGPTTLQRTMPTSSRTTWPSPGSIAGPTTTVGSYRAGSLACVLRSARQMLQRHESELGGAASDTVRDQTDTDADWISTVDTVHVRSLAVAPNPDADGHGSKSPTILTVWYDELRKLCPPAAVQCRPRERNPPYTMLGVFPAKPHACVCVARPHTLRRTSTESRECVHDDIVLSLNLANAQG